MLPLRERFDALVDAYIEAAVLNAQLACELAEKTVPDEDGVVLVVEEQLEDPLDARVHHQRRGDVRRDLGKGRKRGRWSRARP